MSDDEIVEAMARAICEERTWVGAWERANEVERAAWQRDARAALAVARPMIEAPLKEALREIAADGDWFVNGQARARAALGATDER